MKRPASLFVIKDDDTFYSAPLPDSLQKYLLDDVASKMTVLTEDEYIQGHAALLSSAARYSYVLDESAVFWCVEWRPGLVVVRFHPDEEMRWVALRSPVPEFGGREPDPHEVENYDPDAVNPQYDLVFTAWDAMFDEQYRAWNFFSPASRGTVQAFNRALAGPNALQKKSDDSDPEWLQRALENVDRWSGTGVRIP